MEPLLEILSTVDPQFAKLPEDQQAHIALRLAERPEALDDLLSKVDPKFAALKPEDRQKIITRFTLGMAGPGKKAVAALERGTAEAAQHAANLGKLGVQAVAAAAPTVEAAQTVGQMWESAITGAPMQELQATEAPVKVSQPEAQAASAEVSAKLQRAAERVKRYMEKRGAYLATRQPKTFLGKLGTGLLEFAPEMLTTFAVTGAPVGKAAVTAAEVALGKELATNLLGKSVERLLEGLAGGAVYGAATAEPGKRAEEAVREAVGFGSTVPVLGALGDALKGALGKVKLRTFFEHLFETAAKEKNPAASKMAEAGFETVKQEAPALLEAPIEEVAKKKPEVLQNASEAMKRAVELLKEEESAKQEREAGQVYEGVSAPEVQAQSQEEMPTPEGGEGVRGGGPESPAEAPQEKTPLILTKSGKPFASERVAKGMATRLTKQTGTPHEPVEIEGGWAVRPKVEQPKEGWQYAIEDMRKLRGEEAKVAETPTTPTETEPTQSVEEAKAETERLRAQYPILMAHAKGEIGQAIEQMADDLTSKFPKMTKGEAKAVAAARIAEQYGKEWEAFHQKLRDLVFKGQVSPEYAALEEELTLNRKPIGEELQDLTGTRTLLTDIGQVSDEALAKKYGPPLLSLGTTLDDRLADMKARGVSAREAWREVEGYEMKRRNWDYDAFERYYEQLPAKYLPREIPERAPEARDEPWADEALKKIEAKPKRPPTVEDYQSLKEGDYVRWEYKDKTGEGKIVGAPRKMGRYVARPVETPEGKKVLMPWGPKVRYERVEPRPLIEEAAPTEERVVHGMEPEQFWAEIRSILGKNVAFPGDAVYINDPEIGWLLVSKDPVSGGVKVEQPRPIGTPPHEWRAVATRPLTTEEEQTLAEHIRKGLGIRVILKRANEEPWEGEQVFRMSPKVEMPEDIIEEARRRREARKPQGPQVLLRGTTKAKAERFAKQHEGAKVEPDELNPGRYKVVRLYAGLPVDQIGNAATKLGEALKELAKPFAPTVTEKGATAAAIYRSKIGRFTLLSDQFIDRAIKAKRAFYSLPKEAGWAFYDLVEAGKTKPEHFKETLGVDSETATRLAYTAKLWRKTSDDLWKEMNKRGLLDEYVEEYVPHLYKHTQQARGSLRNYFLKKRRLPTYAEARELGLEPLYDNPVDLLTRYIHDVGRLIAWHDTVEDLKKQGLAGYFGKKANIPEDWKRVEGVRTRYGQELWAQKDVATILNNLRKKGLYGREGVYGTIYDSVRHFNNVYTAANLSLSAYHATFSAVTDMANSLALAVSKASRGDLIGAVKEFGHITPLGVFKHYTEGRRLAHILTHPEDIKTEQEAIFYEFAKAAHVSPRLDRHYKLSGIEKFLEAYKGRKPVAATLRLPLAVLEFAVKPIMEKMVPYLKLSAFNRLLAEEIERAGPATKTELLKIAAHVYDMVEDRFGQMSYDNLFWDKTLKDILMIMLRSVGWNYGDLRELAGAGENVVDVASKLLRTGKIKHSDISNRVFFVLSLPAVVAAYGAALSYLFGTKPKKLIDYFGIKTGRKLPSGQPERLFIASYVKDWVALAKEKLPRMFINKASPIVHIASSLLMNKDYWNREIYSPDAALNEKLKDIATFIAKEALPFSVQGAKRRYELGAPASGVALPFVGLFPAPRYFAASKAVNYIVDRYYAGRGKILKETAEKVEKRHQISTLWNRGKKQEALRRLREMLRNHEITPRGAQMYLRHLRMKDPIAYFLHSLPVEAQVEAYKKMTPEERKKYWRHFTSSARLAIMREERKHGKAKMPGQ